MYLRFLLGMLLVARHPKCSASGDFSFLLIVVGSCSMIVWMGEVSGERWQAHWVDSCCVCWHTVLRAAVVLGQLATAVFSGWTHSGPSHFHLLLDVASPWELLPAQKGQQ